MTRGRHRLGVELLEDRTAPAQFTWTGAGNDYLWDDPGNWDQGGELPGALDDVNIGPTASPIVIDGPAEARSIMSSAAIDIQSAGDLALGAGGSIFGNLRVWGSLALADGFAVSLSTSSLDLTGQLQLGTGTQLSPMGASALHDGALVTGDGLLVLNYTTLALDGATTVSNLDALGATLVGPGSLTVTDTINLQGATLARDYLDTPGTLNIDLGATLNLTGSTATTIHGWTINGEGTINWTQGDVNNYASTVNVIEGASFNITTSMGTWRDSALDGLSSINNAGTLTKSGGMGMSVTVEAAINSSGSTNIQSGSLQLRGGGALSGSLDVSAAGDLTLSKGQFTAADLIQPAGQNQGPLIIDNTTDTFASLIIALSQMVGIPSVTLANVELRAGTLDGPGGLVINTRFVWSGGSMEGTGYFEARGQSEVNFSRVNPPDGDLVLARTLRNYGTMTLVGRQSDVTLSVQHLSRIL